MRDNYVPPELEALRHRAENAFEPFRTRLARARELPLPHIAPPNPDELRAAAQHPNAPAALKAVERAVRDGRTTWPDVISGRADRLPEVTELHRASVQHLLNAQHEKPDATPAAPRPKPARRARPREDWEEDGPPDTFMRRGW
jgi:hypothetical protein